MNYCFFVVGEDMDLAQYYTHLGTIYWRQTLRRHSIIIRTIYDRQEYSVQSTSTAVTAINKHKKWQWLNVQRMFQGRTRDAPHGPDFLLSLDSEHNLSMHEGEKKKKRPLVSLVYSVVIVQSTPYGEYAVFDSGATPYHYVLTSASIDRFQSGRI
ncbi:uncharacterized protein ASPGLDRAFT_1225436 [Aspergillus glaucus CBS 516.65]|uniref:Uncharacterized protein n=1 Tax=Aspergillus glaucus CBS 516.65 TaxID=1160497 RepID=A0A1L9VR73_ASPGL|nr:hypothetical protein ASPGLDRAFT_1225436 [Aspergillus glaucus CBS 516.65]OJJ86407.1 hypothetical protein ASPGLDRAFT_1225436 [Aspergillus glaucus CBS 516.65]